MQELQPGSLLQNGKYRIVKVLGQGGFGITYEGIQTGLDRRVAIKEFFMKDYCGRDGQTGTVSITTESMAEMVNRFREKFIKEARIIASLDHAPHIVRIYDIFEENQTAYYVMEYVDGGSINALVKSTGPLSEDRALDLVIQTAEALSRLHQQQTIHLDVKPANILLRQDRHGHDDTVLIDFGISKHYDQKGQATTTSPAGYSKGFAPLEQYREGGVQSFSPTTDVYGLGATLYYMLTAQTPPEATDIAEEPLQQPANISDHAWHIISQAMQSSRKQRFQSMKDMIKAIRESGYENPPSVDTVIVPSYERRSRRWLYVGSGVALIAAILILFMVLGGKGNSSQEVVVEDEAQESYTEQKEYKYLHSIKKDNKYGFVDGNGNIVIPCQWYDAHEFVNGMAAVADANNRWGYINTRGELVIPCQYESYWYLLDFKEDLVAVKNENGKWGYIDKYGNTVVPFSWTEVLDFSEGLAPVKDDNGKWGYIDKNGAVVLPCVWENAHYFSKEGLAPVMNAQGKWGYIDRSGSFKIPAKWFSAGKFSEGLATVDNQYEEEMCINTEGKVISGKWKYIGYFSEGLAIVMDWDYNYGVIDKSGKIVIPARHDRIDDFSEGMALIWDENYSRGFINRSGEQIIPCVWQEAENFKNGMAWVYDGSTWRLIDKTGQLVTVETP